MENLKIKGLKKIAGDSKDLAGYYGANYYQFNYNTKTQEAFAIEHYDLAHASFTAFEDENIIFIGLIISPTTMQELKERIIARLEEIEATRAFWQTID